MNIDKAMKLSLEELRKLYKVHLKKENIRESTVQTASVDTFYLWRKGNSELFWNVLTATDFEMEAKRALLKTLQEYSHGNVNSLVYGYMSHLRKFRHFLKTEIEIPEEKEMKNTVTLNHRRMSERIVPTPSVEMVAEYLKKWEDLENYQLQEKALNKLFSELCPKNTDIRDVLLKASALNDFYSTNIFSIYPVAKRICSLGIDERLNAGDITLVRDIQTVIIKDKQWNFYSFATKYCSHHNPADYPIYDSFVDEVLRHFRKCDGFSDFANTELKDYVRFKGILIDFRKNYGLEMYNLKEIDQYIWQLGKDYFAKNYISSRN